MFKLFILCLAFLLYIFLLSDADKIRFISTEHPVVTYYNPKYLMQPIIKARRHSRRDPFYYVRAEFYSLWPFHNNITFHHIFYELLTNVYKRSFIEIRSRFCDFIQKDTFIGSAVRQAKLKQSCPFPPGLYVLDNMSLPVKDIPKNFPFTRGRLYVNVTGTYNNAYIFAGHIDMEIKEVRM